MSDDYVHSASSAYLPIIQLQTKNIKHSLLIVAISWGGGGHTGEVAGGKMGEKNL